MLTPAAVAPLTPVAGFVLLTLWSVALVVGTLFWVYRKWTNHPQWLLDKLIELALKRDEVGAKVRKVIADIAWRLGDKPPGA